MNAGLLPSFREQFAVVYDDYMDTLGGGERSALAYAKALHDLGFFVEIISTRPVPEQEKIVTVFGNEFSNIRINRLKVNDLSYFLNTAELSVFVNHTYMSFLPNPAKVGIYSQMFPNHLVSRFSHPREASALASYDLMLSNSSFTKTYADGYWEFPEDRSLILNPPIGEIFVEASKSRMGQKLQKKKQFVHVGRFNPGNHNKNQKVIIEAFIEASISNPILSDWNLVLIGNVNKTEASIAYYNDCKKLIERAAGRIQIKEDLPQTLLAKYLDESFGYIHGTGAFIPPGTDPQRCEHFGLSIIEAMSFGCIPLVYARGGIFDVIEPGISGLPYIDQQGLVEGMCDIAALWGLQEAESMQQAALSAASKQGQAHFTEKLAQYLALALQ